ncbi:MAG: hypothetical protein AAFP13_07720 [Pseudomonadota bacterium]
MNIKAFIVALSAASMATTAFAGGLEAVADDEEIIIPAAAPAGSSVSLPALFGAGAGGTALAVGAGVLGIAAVAALVDDDDDESSATVTAD